MPLAPSSFASAGRLFAVGLSCALSGCAPRLRPLAGAPAPEVRLPAGGLPAGHRRVVFQWQLTDQEVTVRGEGVARVAYPDSARLDFFLGGGLGGSGSAVLVGGELRSRAPDIARRVVPPPPLLWAALGRLALPALSDTVVTTEGGTVRADVGRPVQWRVTFRGDTLVRLERVDGGRIQEWVERTAATRTRYRQEGSRRELSIDVTRSDSVEAFDAAIWTP